MSSCNNSTASDVVFYQLGTKFVDNEREIPEDVSDIMYYTLAVGHHTGVIDCFEERIRCSEGTYDRIVALFEEGSDVHYKLDGVNRRGEIQVDKRHVPVLDRPVKQVLAGLQASGKPGLETEISWLISFSEALDAIKQNPAIYLMGRKRTS